MYPAAALLTLLAFAPHPAQAPMLPVHDFFILQGDYHGVFVVKDRVANEAMNVIADNTELAENFAETVKREIANDDGSYAHIGFHLANDIRNQSPASEVLLTLCGWNIDTLLDKTPPIAIED